MTATTNGGQPVSFSQTSGISEHEWVSDLLRQVADADGGQLRLGATLAAQDLRRIWSWTELRATARDRRTHQIARQELERRGLLDRT